MTLRCKPGDLVAVVRYHPLWPEMFGRVFTVTRADAQGYWYTDPPQIDSSGVHLLPRDPVLRPLRDGPGEDELLRLAGKPKETVT